MNNITYLKDYTPLDWIITHIDLEFKLDAKTTVVHAKLHMQLNGDPSKDVILLGEELNTVYIKVDGQLQDLTTLKQDETSLSLTPPQDKYSFTIETCVNIHPDKNTQLMGLYQSSVILCTQCEAEGFRRITWFTDRPDNLATWTVKLIGDQTLHPVLLSNGDCIEKGVLDQNQHYAIWHDPHPKPSYLFALACGKLELLQDSFTTKDSKHVDLNIWVAAGNEERVKWSMQCLKHAMAWEENVYGLQYDLGQFNIVSVPDFNMGAMENKSLNIFNDKVFLAKTELATDKDFELIDSVIAHEYFHNWTGNRITCRDWFQLSLKEGLTVFRDQQYTEDRYNPTRARIEQAHMMRMAQFKEDAGNLSHPVRPDHFVDISNFYTVTIYEKGAEIIRMLCNMLGKEGYYKGIALYIQRHDGKAVTVEDFIQSFEDACNIDLSQFFLWYTQRGTPSVQLERKYTDGGLTLTFTQTLTNAEKEKKKPQVIPIKLAGINVTGQEVISEQIIILDDWKKTFHFENITDNVVISWNRDFSAPIKTSDDHSFDERLLLAQYDSNIFNRADAFFNCAVQIVIDDAINKQDVTEASQKLAVIIQTILHDDYCSSGEKAALMQLPNASYINQQLQYFEPEAIEKSLKTLKYTLAKRNHEYLKDAFNSVLALDHPEDLSPSAMEKRTFVNSCLSYLACLEDSDIAAYLTHHLTSPTSMTLRAVALSCAIAEQEEAQADAIAHFVKEFENEPLVSDKYFQAKASKTTENAKVMLDTLTAHPQFSLSNPNRVYSVFRSFCNNPANLHKSDGSGYAIICGLLKQLDTINPEVAARLTQALAVKDQLKPELQEKLIQHLSALKAEVSSKNLLENIDRILA